MADSFDGIRLKLRRARNQIDTLRSEFERFLRQEPYRPVSNIHLGKRVLTVSVQAMKTPDPMWGVQIGEILHNLRSALDHSIWELVILETGKTPKLPTKNQFPIFQSKEGFRDRGIPQQLNGVGKKAVELIRDEQPYSTGENLNSPLWHLSELSNADKHRTLHTTGTLLSDVKIKLPDITDGTKLTFIEQSGPGPIQQDSVLFRMRFTGPSRLPFKDMNANANYHFTVSVAFDQATPAVGGHHACGTIDLIEKRTIRILAKLADDIFKFKL